MKKWTEEEESVVRALYPAGKPLKEIATMLDRDQYCIHKKARALGLVRPPIGWELDEKLMHHMPCQPISVTALAHLMQVNPNSMDRVLKRNAMRGLCHIARYDVMPNGTNWRAMWVKGCGVHAKKPKPRIQRKKPEMPDSWVAAFKPFRHWTDIALFGEPA